MIPDCGSRVNKIPADACFRGHAVLITYFSQCNMMMREVIIFPLMFLVRGGNTVYIPPPAQTGRKILCISEGLNFIQILFLYVAFYFRFPFSLPHFIIIIICHFMLSERILFYIFYILNTTPA